MRLHARMAATALLCAIPATALTLWLDDRAQRRAAEDTLVAFVRERARSSRAQCEADPERWSGPRGDDGHDAPGSPGQGPPPAGPASGGPLPPMPGLAGPPGAHPRPAELYPFDAGLRPSSAKAPPISESLRSRWKGTGVAIASESWGSSETEVLVRMPWDGPCAVILGRGTTEVGFGSRLLPSSWVWLTPVGVVLGAVLLALLPLVRRVKRLTEEVGSSAKAGYVRDVTVEGGDELTDLARAFGDASKAIREQLAERDRRELALRDFLANTTHDVMIPLTVLQGHLVTLQERERARPPAETGEREPDATLVSAMDEAHYLASILHNLAAVARLDAMTEAVRRHRVDLRALVGRVLARHRPIAKQRDIELDGATPEEEATTLADVTLLEQAVSNLVYNAVRHNRAGGHVAVVLATEGDGFSIKVIDDGPGIAADQIERLLERGTRGDAARSRSPGQGLGLAIANRVVGLHEFSLALRASEYGGLEAEVRGPLAPPPAGPAPH